MYSFRQISEEINGIENVVYKKDIIWNSIYLCKNKSQLKEILQIYKNIILEDKELCRLAAEKYAIFHDSKNAVLLLKEIMKNNIIPYDYEFIEDLFSIFLNKKYLEQLKKEIEHNKVYRSAYLLNTATDKNKEEIIKKYEYKFREIKQIIPKQVLIEPIIRYYLNTKKFKKVQNLLDEYLCEKNEKKINELYQHFIDIVVKASISLRTDRYINRLIKISKKFTLVKSSSILHEIMMDYIKYGDYKKAKIYLKMLEELTKEKGPDKISCVPFEFLYEGYAALLDFENAKKYIELGIKKTKGSKKYIQTVISEIQIICRITKQKNLITLLDYLFEKFSPLKNSGKKDNIDIFVCALLALGYSELESKNDKIKKLIDFCFSNKGKLKDDLEKDWLVTVIGKIIKNTKISGSLKNKYLKEIKKIVDSMKRYSPLKIYNMFFNRYS
jgi:hypothetical protein